MNLFFGKGMSMAGGEAAFERFEKTASGLYATLNKDLTDVTDRDFNHLADAVADPNIFFLHPEAHHEVASRSGWTVDTYTVYLDALVFFAHTRNFYLLVTALFASTSGIQTVSFYSMRRERVDSLYRKLLITEFLEEEL